jgi:hypothetical protein
MVLDILDELQVFDLGLLLLVLPFALPYLPHLWPRHVQLLHTFINITVSCMHNKNNISLLIFIKRHTLAL